MTLVLNRQTPELAEQDIEAAESVVFLNDGEVPVPTTEQMTTAKENMFRVSTLFAIDNKDLLPTGTEIILQEDCYAGSPDGEASRISLVFDSRAMSAFRYGWQFTLVHRDGRDEYRLATSKDNTVAIKYGIDKQGRVMTTNEVTGWPLLELIQTISSLSSGDEVVKTAEELREKRTKAEEVVERTIREHTGTRKKLHEELYGKILPGGIQGKGKVAVVAAMTFGHTTVKTRPH